MPQVEKSRNDKVKVTHPITTAVYTQLLMTLCIRAMITTLPETYGRVVELRVCQDRSVRQTAQQLNISPSNVTTRLNRAIKMIKCRLDRRRRA